MTTVVDVETIQQSVQQTLTSVVDPGYLANIQELVPSGWRIQGVRAPQLRALATELRKTHSAVGVETVAMRAILQR